MTLQQLRYAIAVADCGSMNQAAAKLFISQPSLSEAVKELEGEIGIRIFGRTNRGIIVTTEGNEFLGYARQVVEQYRLMEQRYVEKTQTKKRFAVSMQHYTFAVKAFVEMVKEFGMDDYAFAIHETKTGTVIEHVKDFISEIGILYMSDFNRKILMKLIHESELEFIPLFDCNTYVYVWKKIRLHQSLVLAYRSLKSIHVLRLIRERQIHSILQRRFLVPTSINRQFR